MNSWDATAPFPLSRRDMPKTRSWRHGTLTKVILLSTFIFNLLTFRNLSQRLKVKNGDFKHFTCISAWEIRAWHVPSHPGWVGSSNFFWGFFSHGTYVWAYTRQNLRNFGFLNHPNGYQLVLLLITLTCCHFYIMTNELYSIYILFSSNLFRAVRTLLRKAFCYCVAIMFLLATVVTRLNKSK